MERSLSGQQQSEDELGVWRGLLRVHAGVNGRLDAELQRRHGLTLTEWEVLLSLDRAPEGRLRVGDIAGFVLLTPGGVTRLVARLEQRGLVARVPHATDRRGTAVRLTGAGRDRYRAADVEGMVRRLFLDRLTPEQRAQLAAIWEAVLPGAATLDAREWALRR